MMGMMAMIRMMGAAPSTAPIMLILAIIPRVVKNVSVPHGHRPHHGS